MGSCAEETRWRWRSEKRRRRGEMDMARSASGGDARRALPLLQEEATLQNFAETHCLRACACPRRAFAHAALQQDAMFGAAPLPASRCTRTRISWRAQRRNARQA